jgi:hypothetical protein
MSVFLQPIYTQTVGASGPSSITFNNIPQTFTDLKLVVSSRCDGATVDVLGAIRFNGDSANNYSDTNIYGNGSSAMSARHSTNSFAYAIETNGTSATSSTFGNNELYLPNYTGSNYKQFINDSVAETNASSTNSGNNLLSGLWRSTAAITSMQIFPGGGYNFTQYSTFSLYGVLRQGI